MVAEARLKSKNLYKVELYLLKIMPMVIALAYLVNTVSSYFGVDIPILASILKDCGAIQTQGLLNSFGGIY